MSSKEDARIFVGGLSWDTSERQLEDAFSRFGKVIEAQLEGNFPWFCQAQFMFSYSQVGLDGLLERLLPVEDAAFQFGPSKKIPDTFYAV